MGKRGIFRVTAALGATGMGLALMTGTASAAKPQHAGPPERETIPIVGSGEPVIVCADREIMFTDGSLVTRFRELPRNRAIGGFVLRDVTATDGETEFKARGQVRFRFTEEAGTFSVHLVLIGPGGQVETVRETTTFRGDEVTFKATGSCSLRFDEEETPDEGETP